MESLQPLIQGDVAAPLALASKLQVLFRLLGPQGFTGIVMAAIDMAAWDVLAKSAGLSLSGLLSGEEKPIPAYHSLGMAGPEGAAREAAESIGLGFRCVKFKVGYPHAEQDRAVIRAARGAADEDLQVMVAYNQSLSVPEAIRRVQLLDEEALVWVEEPTRADDFAGHARIAAECRTPIQIGENLSTQVLAVSPQAHWLEYQDWAAPICSDHWNSRTVLVGSRGTRTRLSVTGFARQLHQPRSGERTADAMWHAPNLVAGTGKVNYERP
jgi:hypothetical protein